MRQLALTFAYPMAPGARKTDTSREAAREVEPRVRAAHAEILELLRAQEMTADELAAALKRSILFMRPRITELNKLGRITDSGKRRKNMSGKSAIVWCAA